MLDRRALIVGDAAGPTEAATNALARAGFAEVIAVSKLEQAVSRLRTEPFDMLILPLSEVRNGQRELLEREIRARPALSVIGTAPETDPELILRGMRSGVHEFLVSPPGLDELAAAAQRLTKARGVVRTGRIIAVYSGKGGLGTTTIAVNLADAMAARSPVGTVALLDGVFTGGDIQVFLNLRPTYDLGDLVARLDQIDPDMLRSFMTLGPHGAQVLPSPQDHMFDDAFDGANVNTILEQMRGTFETTIIDCEHQLSERTLAILDAADTILVVTQPNVPALQSTKRTLQLFGRLGYRAEKMQVVINRFQVGDVFTLRNVAESIGRDVTWSLPNDYRAASGALNKGVAVTQQDPGSKLVVALGKLAADLCQPAESRTTETRVEATPRSRLQSFFGKSR